MINYARRYNRGRYSHKIEQSSPKIERPPAGALLLDSLRTLENELVGRGMISAAQGTPHSPLWFLAETERNVYLWRAGYSLIEQDEFEFWVDVPRLIEKRLKQLGQSDHENPFTNPAWGLLTTEPVSSAAEQEYLQSLLEVFCSIMHHTHAISQVTSIIKQEVSNNQIVKPVIVLPLASPGPR